LWHDQSHRMPIRNYIDVAPVVQIGEVMVG
jgi:hypothetical protein